MENIKVLICVVATLAALAGCTPAGSPKEPRFGYVQITPATCPQPQEVKGILFFTYYDINDPDTKVFFLLGDRKKVENALGRHVSPERERNDPNGLAAICRVYKAEINEANGAGFVQSRDAYGAMLLVTDHGSFYDRFDTDGERVAWTPLTRASAPMRRTLEDIGVFQKHDPNLGGSM
jgi:hypothetical protein